MFPLHPSDYVARGCMTRSVTFFCHSLVTDGNKSYEGPGLRRLYFLFFWLLFVIWLILLFLPLLSALAVCLSVSRPRNFRDPESWIALAVPC